ncbi:UDP-glucose/GDP-mannose dehydrogenase family protein [Aquibacillus sp. 3ASR75-11]|uniref:UDP-glucose 6-dehydrogenase n=1 Tax=Terrihalobacillus insolitus TaxID=2950438 RepID=A0A9X3WUW4_9BACI|nr:UDP-glucose/GDP-mannose dehydrogenase family protein [Terrihalobacillus insolitus]MDC3423839.1 UDP-glucose/GDP-mannose dehydrogenase family protein [Terrihalobacillus insolitus]
MNIAVVGVGYVGLVTGVSLAEIGHHVTCIDNNKEKVHTLQSGIAPFFEPGLDELMKKNVANGRLAFADDLSSGCSNAEIVYIAVGTPQKNDGTVDLTDIEKVAIDLAHIILQDMIVVTKSTVPVGTNEYIKQLIDTNIVSSASIEVVANPEFLREGSAIHDTFHGDRIVIGSNNEWAATVIESVNKPFDIPIVKTDLRNAEMIKYASNAFLATKISFINEIANLCEKIGANVDDVAYGMGLDQRIGNAFLQAGIGYGGSCFPKDTRALVQLSGNMKHEFQLLKSVITINHNQQKLLIRKAIDRFQTLADKRIALLGLAFKPNTDDMREAASIPIVNELLKEGVDVVVYDPATMETAKKIFLNNVQYADSIETAITGADIVFILTEWDEFKRLDIHIFNQLMKDPVVFDGRNCFDLDQIKKAHIEYHSIGRPTVYRKT